MTQRCPSVFAAWGMPTGACVTLILGATRNAHAVNTRTSGGGGIIIRGNTQTTNYGSPRNAHRYTTSPTTATLTPCERFGLGSAPRYIPRVPAYALSVVTVSHPQPGVLKLNYIVGQVSEESMMTYLFTTA